MSAWDNVDGITGFISALAAVAAAVVAALAARQSRISAEQANQASAAMLTIEQDRRHSEMTPQFQVEFNGSGLLVTLIGPVGLDQLDNVALRVRGPGPLKIILIEPLHRRPDALGLSANSGLLQVGSHVMFGLGPAEAPTGWEDAWDSLKGATLQFTLAARHATYGSWAIPGNFDISKPTPLIAHLPGDQPRPRS